MNPSVRPSMGSKKLFFENVVKENDALYARFLKEGSELVAEDKKDELEQLVQKVDSLLESLQAIANSTTFWHEYETLTDAIFRWQVVFASILNIPKKIVLPTPQSNLLPPLSKSKALTENEIEYLVKRNSEYLAKMDQARNSSFTDFGIDRNQSASIFLASDILEGKINLASRISSESYWRLEEIWIQDIKKLIAYLLWEDRGRSIDTELEIADFIKASDQTRKLLVNSGIKAQRSEFGEAKEYLEKRFLSPDSGKLDFQRNEVSSLISSKEKKIQKETGCTDFDKNWEASKYYIELFYNNIIPAIINESEASKDSILAILKAFQFSQHGNNGQPYHIINAFEAALIIYFVDKNIILSFWEKSANHPKPNSFLKSTVKLQYSKDDFLIPTELENRFEFLEGMISFQGVMTSTECESVKQRLSTKEYQKAVDNLFEKSRLIHEETTL